LEKSNEVRTACTRFIAAASFLSAMFFALPAPVAAQSAADLNAKIAALEGSVKSAQSAGESFYEDQHYFRSGRRCTIA